MINQFVLIQKLVTSLINNIGHYNKINKTSSKNAMSLHTTRGQKQQNTPPENTQPKNL
jgi:hypothetical protein